MKTPEQLRAFEQGIRELWQAGELPCLLHLCGGNENWLCGKFQPRYDAAKDWVFSSHRNHFHALIAGIPEDELRREILAGNSMFTFSRERRFFSSSILAGSCSIAAGVAWTLKERGEGGHVWCFLGDGSCEEGNAYEAMLFVEANALPCTFIIEDNNRQVDTTIAERQPHPTRGLEQLFDCVERMTYAATFPHAGDGSKPGAIKFKPEAIERMRK